MSRKLCNVRIHVEKAIERMKRFKILQTVFEISFLKTSKETEYATIDKLCNPSSHYRKYGEYAHETCAPYLDTWKP